MIEALLVIVAIGIIVYLWDEKRRERALGAVSVSTRGWLRGYRASHITMAGDALCRRQHYREALEQYSKAIELDPKLAVAYNNRGFVHWNLNNYEQAITDYSRAIELKPKYAMAYNNRAFAHKALGNKEAAIADFEKVLKWAGDKRLAAQAREQIAELKD